MVWLTSCIFQDYSVAVDVTQPACLGELSYLHLCVSLDHIAQGLLAASDCTKLWMYLDPVGRCLTQIDKLGFNGQAWVYWGSVLHVSHDKSVNPQR